MSLTQAEADRLIDVEKRFLVERPVVLPAPGKWWYGDLISVDRREEFRLGIFRGRLGHARYTAILISHSQSNAVLVRLDVGVLGVHPNPDGTRVAGSHLHLYREGYDDKFAYPIVGYPFSDPDDIVKGINDFFLFCKVVAPPPIWPRLIP